VLQLVIDDDHYHYYYYRLFPANILFLRTCMDVLFRSNFNYKTEKSTITNALSAP